MTAATAGRGSAAGIRGRLTGMGRQAVRRVSGRDEATGSVDPRRRRRTWALVVLLTMLGLALVAGYPLRTYFSQKGELRDIQSRLAVVQHENGVLADRKQALQSDSEIERLARERYHLVKPGEEVYPILPAPPPPVSVPAVWPFTKLAPKLDSAAAARR